MHRLDPTIGAYRARAHAKELVSFRVALKESDLQIACSRLLRDEALIALQEHRHGLEAYIREHPEFLHSLMPVAVHVQAPPVVAAMARAAALAGVGPMAAVAGALADKVGRALLAKSREVIVENGGDIFCRAAQPRVLAIDSGPSPLSYRFGLKISPAMGEIGVCTSSGTCGGSLSFGRADAACVIAASATLADAAATAVGNRVADSAGIEAGLAVARTIPGVWGAVIIVGESMGAWGDIELVEIGT